MMRSALKKGLISIYGYTSDADGIRHALIEGNTNVEYDDTLFMLVLCSAFMNYISAKNK